MLPQIRVMQIQKSLYSLLILVIVVFSTCKKNEDDQGDNFDRAAMLLEYRESFIIPAFEHAVSKSEALRNAAELFSNDKSTDNFATIQQSWKEAALSWEAACAYNFGPAGEEGTRKALNEEIATFPVSESKMETILAGGNYSLNDHNRDARGLFAIEYLIFSRETDNETLIELFSNSQRTDFLLALCTNYKERLATVESEWKGAYGNSFISDAGTAVGSPVSELYNEFVKSYETLKNYKFGIPLGLMSGQNSTEPELVEAYYSGFSFLLAEAHYHALHEIWNGKDGKTSFRSWLNSVEGGAALVAETEAGFNSIQTKFDAVADTSVMSMLIENNPTKLIEIHTEIQKNTRFVKSEMSSLLGIAITYSSGDGD